VRAGGDWDDDWATADDGGGPPDEVEGRPQARVILGVVLGVVMLASLVLCCVAAGQLGQLFWLDVPPP
jgi:hypothetical protein